MMKMQVTLLCNVFTIFFFFCLLNTIRAFLFPEDQEIELEYWAETGEFSSMELYQMKVRHICALSRKLILF